MDMLLLGFVPFHVYILICNDVLHVGLSPIFHVFMWWKYEIMNVFNFVLLKVITCQLVIWNKLTNSPKSAIPNMMGYVGWKKVYWIIAKTLIKSVKQVRIRSLVFYWVRFRSRVLTRLIKRVVFRLGGMTRLLNGLTWTRHDLTYVPPLM